MTKLKKTLAVLVLLVAVFLIASGWTDLDWMMVENHFQMWNATKNTWEFCPFLTMDWWLAFEFTLARIVIGFLILGIYCKWLWDLLTKMEKVKFD